MSVFSTRDVVTWRLDDVKNPAPALEGNENSIFNKETALQYFPGQVWVLSSTFKG